jgi:hypothetical protein
MRNDTLKTTDLKDEKELFEKIHDAIKQVEAENKGILLITFEETEDHIFKTQQVINNVSPAQIAIGLRGLIKAFPNILDALLKEAIADLKENARNDPAQEKDKENDAA